MGKPCRACAAPLILLVLLSARLHPSTPQRQAGFRLGGFGAQSFSIESPACILLGAKGGVTLEYGNPQLTVWIAPSLFANVVTGGFCAEAGFRATCLTVDYSASLFKYSDADAPVTVFTRNINFGIRIPMAFFDDMESGLWLRTSKNLSGDTHPPDRSKGRALISGWGLEIRFWFVP